MTKGKVDWGQVDWLKSNDALAEEYGVAVSTVSNRRALLGLQHLTPHKRRAARRRAEVRRLRLRGLGGRAIAQRTGLSEFYVFELLRDMGLGRGSPVLAPAGWVADWEAVDWSKSDRKLAKELGVHFTTVYRQRRKRKELGLL